MKELKKVDHKIIIERLLEIKDSLSLVKSLDAMSDENKMNMAIEIYKLRSDHEKKIVELEFVDDTVKKVIAVWDKTNERFREIEGELHEIARKR
jgi:hypothetical protein